MEDNVQEKNFAKSRRKRQNEKEERKDKTIRASIKNPTSECSRKREHRKLWEGNY